MKVELSWIHWKTSYFIDEYLFHRKEVFFAWFDQDVSCVFVKIFISPIHCIVEGAKGAARALRSPMLINVIHVTFGNGIGVNDVSDKLFWGWQDSPSQDKTLFRTIFSGEENHQKSVFRQNPDLTHLLCDRQSNFHPWVHVIPGTFDHFVVVCRHKTIHGVSEEDERQHGLDVVLISNGFIPPPPTELCQ